MSGYRYGSPWAYPGDIHEIRVSYRCLQPPHIYRDLDGYWCMPPVIRFVTPSTMKAPRGFEHVVQPRAVHIAMLPILKAMMISPIEDWVPTKHIHRFGVDRVCSS
jgi:hypothetical protein